MRIIHFDANGWRARFDDGFDEESVGRIACALGLVWGGSHPGSTVLVGYDTRHNGKHFAELVAAILAGQGLCAKVSSTTCPIPALGWSAAHNGACVGAVMLSASESSCEYGGIQLRGADGGPVSSRFLAKVERAIPTRVPRARGSFAETDVVTAYEDALVSFVDADAIAAAGLRVVADPMYGGGVGVLARVLDRLGCDVVRLHDEAREDFAGLHPSATDPWADECEQRLVETGANLAIVLDGDGDRSAVVDERGRLVSPHNLVPLVMRQLMGKGYTGRVVATSSSSERLMRQADYLGCPRTRVPVGFERLYDELHDNDVLIASEEYGGICVPQHLKERDGLLAGLLVVELLAQEGGTLSRHVRAMMSELGHLSYIRKDVYMEPAQVESMRIILPGLNPASIGGLEPQEISHADGLRASFADGSWVLVRPSRTLPVIRANAEARDASAASALLSGALSAALDALANA